MNESLLDYCNVAWFGYGDNFLHTCLVFLENGFVVQRSKSEAFERIARLALYLLIILDVTSSGYVQESKSNFEHTLLIPYTFSCIRAFVISQSCGLISLFGRRVPTSVCAIVACSIAPNHEQAQLIGSQTPYPLLLSI